MFKHTHDDDAAMMMIFSIQFEEVELCFILNNICCWCCIACMWHHRQHQPALPIYQLQFKHVWLAYEALRPRDWNCIKSLEFRCTGEVSQPLLVELYPFSLSYFGFLSKSGRAFYRLHIVLYLLSEETSVTFVLHVHSTGKFYA